MGQSGGLGNEGVDPKGSGPKLSPNILIGGGGEDLLLPLRAGQPLRLGRVRQYLG